MANAVVCEAKGRSRPMKPHRFAQSGKPSPQHLTVLTADSKISMGVYPEKE
jgi:hypothetical protein